jgi:hypothetical protein
MMGVAESSSRYDDIGIISKDGNFKVQRHHYRRNIYGNTLIAYWSGRSMAAYANLTYINTMKYDKDQLINYLPRRVEPNPLYVNLSHYNRSREKALLYDKNWGTINTEDIQYYKSVIVSDTHKALNDMNVAIPNFMVDDVVIHFRCDHDVILQHRVYGPFGISRYNVIPNTTKNIYISLNYRMLEGEPICPKIFNVYIDHIKTIRPLAKIVKLNGNLLMDYAYMVHAPIFIPSVSTFSTVASLANNNTVMDICNNDVDVHNCYGRRNILLPSLATELGIKRDNHSKILEWIKNH